MLVVFAASVAFLQVRMQSKTMSTLKLEGQRQCQVLQQGEEKCLIVLLGGQHADQSSLNVTSA